MTPQELEQRFLEHTHNEMDGTTKVSQSCFVNANLVSTLPATAANYGVFFTADRPCVVTDFRESHTVAGSDGGTVTLQLEKIPSGVALDSGTELLKTALSLKTTANTPQRGILVKSKTGLAIGDRLALKDAGTLTAVAGLSTTTTIQY